MREIPEYPEYLISEKGEVYSTKSNRYLNVQINTTGYPFFTVQKDGKSKHILLHRALARVYKELPSLSSELEVDHKDRIKINFDLDNLQVLSAEDHMDKTLTERGLSRSNNVCKVCGIKISPRATSCTAHSQNKPEVSVEDIEYWVTNYSWSRASRELGMSDNGLRKRYKALTGNDPKQLKKVKT